VGPGGDHLDGTVGHGHGQRSGRTTTIREGTKGQLGMARAATDVPFGRALWRASAPTRRGGRRLPRPAWAGALSDPPACAALVGAVGLAAGLAVGTGTGLVAGAAPAGASSTHAKTITISASKLPRVGTVLTTASGLTLYRFTADPSGRSTCTGACAQVWPPLTVAKGTHVKGPKGAKGFSLIKVGKTWQVAFHNAALYRFEGDKKKGQAKGQGLEGTWFAVVESGAFTTGAAAATSASTPTSAAVSPTTHPLTPTTHSVTPTTQAAHVATPTSPPAAVTPSPPPTNPPPPTTTPPPSTNSGSGGGYGY
jgi:predicted lipoprotein with Yx(FWY)xxD motif